MVEGERGWIVMHLGWDEGLGGEDVDRHGR